MPFVRVELTAGQYVKTGAGCKGYVCYDEAGMVGWEGIVNGVRQYSEAAVQEEDDNEDDEGEHAELDAGADLSHVR